MIEWYAVQYAGIYELDIGRLYNGHMRKAKSDFFERLYNSNDFPVHDNG